MPTLGLYVQFPFCASKCSFCNFGSRVAHAAAYQPYIRAIGLETDLIQSGVLSLQGIAGDFLSFPIGSVYCGGGTPSLAGIEGITAIFRCLRENFVFRRDAEWTVEITPRSADRSLLEVMLELGANRLSIGAQSFNDRELASVGRVHTAADTEQQVALARDAGFRNVSLDLIAGLPHQTKSSWRASLETVSAIRPEHISIYLFEVDDRSRLGKEVIAAGNRYHAGAIPGEDFVADSYLQAGEVLAREGYCQYEISNFALPGFESRHNQRYWQLEPYLGLGAGAHSFDGAHRWANEIEPCDYEARLAREELPLAEIRSLTPVEQVEEFFFLGLRQRQGVSLERARGRWGTRLLTWWEERARELEEEGFLRERDGILTLAEGSYLVSNEIFERFLV
jgi:oxygen-independent coproporphyrinogen III oxidase